MDNSRFPMAPSREPNPLRPYYIPPSIGASPSVSPSTSRSPHIAKTSVPRASASISTTARDLFPELEIDLKSTTSEAWQHTRSLFDTLAWRYTSVLLAQPFDVAKMILQVTHPPPSAANATPQKRRAVPAQSRGSRAQDRGLGGHEDEAGETDEDQDSESDNVHDYFSATAPCSRSPRRKRRMPPSESISPSPTPRPRDRREQGGRDEFKLALKKPDSVMVAIAEVYRTSGAVGLWRASNTSFLYSVLLRTTDSFVRSLLLAVLGLPDIPGPDQGGLAPGLSASGGAGFSGIDLSDSTNALGSLVVIGLASCITGLILAPLDLVRTRLIVTPMSTSPRGLVQNLRRLPSLVVASELWLPTALFHSIPNIFSAATPLFLRRQLHITPELSPALWSLAAFGTSLTELFVRLPLETVVRRAQVSSIARAQPETPLIVDPAPYAGVWHTVYAILYAEGETTTRAANGSLRTRPGQGSAGLVRGWRIGFWGLVGVWAAGALAPADAKGRAGQF